MSIAPSKKTYTNTAIGLALCATILALSPTAAHATEFNVGVTAGTLGIGPEVGFRPLPFIGLRANASFLSVSDNVSSSGVNYDGKLKLKSYGVMADVYPFGGGLRLSGGLRVNKNRIGLGANLLAGETINIGDMEYTTAEIGTLNGNIRTKDLAPVATIGYVSRLVPWLALGIEAGVMFQGSPRITDLQSTGGSLSDSAALQAQLDAEQQEIEDDIDVLKYYPVLQLTALFRF